MKTSIQFIVIALLAIISGSTISAQEKEEYSKWEIYGGYSSLRFEKNSESGDQTTTTFGKNAERKGFEFSATRNLNRFIGLKFDYSRNSNDERFSFPGPGGTPSNLAVTFKSNLYAGGVQFKDNAAKTKIKPFAHVLLGVMAASEESRFLNCPVGQPVCSGIEKGNRFAAIIGGGIDIKVNRRFSIRPIQVDYVRLNKAVQSVNAVNPDVIGKGNFRFGAGVVFHTDRTEVETKSSTKNFSKYEVHVGYTFNMFKSIDIQPIATIDLKSMHGYNASIKWNFQRFLGAEFEQSSGWSDTETLPFGPANSTIRRALHTYTGGIQVKDNSPKARIKPFGHALFGVASAVAKLTFSDIGPTIISDKSGFLMIFGGGLDIKLNDGINLRPFQFDYLRTSKNQLGFDNQNGSYRISAGIVFH